jgi:hypothetical protein
MVPPIKIRANTSASNGVSSSVYVQESLCCRTWGSVIARLAGIPPTVKAHEIAASKYGLVRIDLGTPLFNRGGSAPAPQAPRRPGGP